MIRRTFDRWQVRRVRRAYTSVGGRRSDKADYDGMIEEMTAGNKQLDESDRRLADDRVLAAIFFGRPAMAVLRGMGKVAPGPTSSLLAILSPHTLRWLVGPLTAEPGGQNRVPLCRFRDAGGPDLCASVCRRPTERFTADAGFPVQLVPDATGGCDWTWRSASRR